MISQTDQPLGRLSRRFLLPCAFLCLLCSPALPAGASVQEEQPAAVTGPTAAAAPARQLGYREAVILGIIEGITEFLPISSTGHLLLANALLRLDSTDPILDERDHWILSASGQPVTLKEAADAYAIVIQAGAILAVLLLYWERIWQVILGVFGLSPTGRLLARNLIVAFLPAAVLGFLLDDWIEAALFAPLPIAVALFAGGVLMLGVERWRSRQASCDSHGPDLHELQVRQALLIGLLQCVAMWPGTSRSMMTIVGGYLAGLAPARAAEFSFLLGLITLTAAAGYKAVSSGPALLVAIDLGPMLVGILVAFVCAALAIRWLVGYLTRHGLAIFAYYRFLLAAAVVTVLVM